jgi:nitrogen fixation protein FixH
MTRPFTGWHMLAICLAFFGTIIAVNVTLAVKAVSTFPGLEVENSYVASQTFDADRKAQQALGWHLAQAYAPGRLQLTITDRAGFAADLRDLTVTLGRATEAKDDRTPVFRKDGQAWVADVTLALGKWVLFVTAHASDGTLYQKRVYLTVRA